MPDIQSSRCHSRINDLDFSQSWLVLHVTFGKYIGTSVDVERQRLQVITVTIGELLAKSTTDLANVHSLGICMWRD